MRKLRNTESELQKALLIKKKCVFRWDDPPTSWCENGAAERSTIHEIDFHKEMTTVLVLPENDLI